MVAFGALEYDPPIASAAYYKNLGDDTYLARRAVADEVFTLVVAEFLGLGWLIATLHLPKSFILLGPIVGNMGFKGRPKIAEGSLQDVCKAAVARIDGTCPPAYQDIYPE